MEHNIKIKYQRCKWKKSKEKILAEEDNNFKSNLITIPVPSPLLKKCITSLIPSMSWFKYFDARPAAVVYFFLQKKKKNRPDTHVKCGANQFSAKYIVKSTRTDYIYSHIRTFTYTTSAMLYNSQTVCVRRCISIFFSTSFSHICHRTVTTMGQKVMGSLCIYII